MVKKPLTKAKKALGMDQGEQETQQSTSTGSHQAKSMPCRGSTSSPSDGDG